MTDWPAGVPQRMTADTLREWAEYAERVLGDPITVIRYQGRDYVYPDEQDELLALVQRKQDAAWS